MNTWRPNCTRSILNEIAKFCLSLLCTPSSWDSYDQTLVTQEGYHEDRHLLLYAAVFWPWHLYRCGDINGYQMLIRLCNAFISETNHQRWLKYHHLTVKLTIPINDFWLRVNYLYRKDDLLYTACVFGLSQMLTAIFEMKPCIKEACISHLLFTAVRFGLVWFWFVIFYIFCAIPKPKAYDSTVRFGGLEVARLLIDKGADVSVVNTSV